MRHHRTSANLPFSFLPPEEPNPGGLTEAYNTLLSSLPTGTTQPRTLVGVGWHTRSHQRLLEHRGFKRIIWSHGVGSTAIFPSRPLLSLLRFLVRIPELFSLIQTLCLIDALVVAYDRTSISDTRSIDQLFARLLKVTVYVIPNPIDTDFWTPNHRTPPSLNILSIGRHEWQKAHHALFDALVVNPTPFTLTTLAPKQTQYSHKLIELAAKHNLSSRVFHHYQTSRLQRRAFLRQAFCLISYSETEYQSLCILEALSCGCPVIARPTGWLRNTSVPGLLLASSIKDISEHLTNLSRSPAYWSKLSSEARDYTVNNHSLVKVNSLWLNQPLNSLHE